MKTAPQNHATAGWGAKSCLSSGQKRSARQFDSFERLRGAKARFPAHLFLVMLAAGATPLQAASTIQFSANTYSVAESAGSAILSVQRTNDVNTLVTVDYACADGTATNGLKYTAVAGTLSFAAGETNKTIAVPILNNGFVEGTKTFAVVLSNPSGGAVLGAREKATVSISDNDVGIQFRYASYSIAEDAGAVRIGVVRDDDGQGPVTVDYATSDDTARNGTDYVGCTSALLFGPGEGLKFFTISILNNSLKQPDRSFNVSLSKATGGTVRGTTMAKVVIKDNDQGFQFGSASYTVAEDAGGALITVLRGADDTNAISTVDFATADGTATSGLDYALTSGTLSFGPGDKTKLLAVPILNDGVNEPPKAFSVTLSNPTGGAALGSAPITTVSILDNDPGVGFDLASSSVWARAGQITFTVVRGNDAALGPITVDYATIDGTAEAGRDYQAISGTLEFKQDETLKSLAIPILPGAVPGGRGTFRVTLSNPTGGAALGRASTTVTIQKNYCTIAPPFDSKLAIRREDDVHVLTWTGGGQLQRADQVTGPWQTLPTQQATQVAGPWRTLAALQGPYPVSPPTATFYRITPPRPVNVYVPSSYDGHTPMPLLILLHGTSMTGVDMEAMPQFQLTPMAESRGFLYCTPNGGLNWPTGGKAWNQFFPENDPVLDVGGPYIDDIAYLASVIEEVERRFALDGKRIYLTGASGGAFMADSMALARADLIAGIASLSGSIDFDVKRYKPSQPVNILHLQGTADVRVLYWGGTLTPANYPGWPANWTWRPGLLETMDIWAGYNGARGLVTDSAPTLDLMTDLPGLDTAVTRYTDAPRGGAVELWTLIGGGHGLGTPSPQYKTLLIDWLLAHSKP